jgi:hypothetical protein
VGYHGGEEEELHGLEIRHDSRGHRAGLLAALQSLQQAAQRQDHPMCAIAEKVTGKTAVRSTPQTQREVQQTLLQALLQVLEEADSHDREGDDPFSSDALPTKGLLRQRLLLPLHESVRLE